MKKILGALALSLAVVSAAHAALEPLYNNNRLIIGYLEPSGDRTFVRDACQQRLGWVVTSGTNAGTFTMTNLRLSPTPFPLMLLQQPTACGLNKAKVP